MTVAIDETARAGEQYVVPVKVRNKGVRTLKDVKIEVTHQSPDGTQRSQDFDIDYLPEASQETIYLYVDAEPRRAKVRAKAVQYRLE